MDDPELELIKARKMKALQEQLASKDKYKKIIESQNQLKQQKIDENVSERNFLSLYLYDRADEVLKLAEQQYPFQTRIVIRRLNELIRNGDISKISAGDLLSVYRSLNLPVRINTSISISDHGKTISFSEKLKQTQQELESDDTIT